MARKGFDRYSQALLVEKQELESVATVTGQIESAYSPVALELGPELEVPVPDEFNQRTPNLAETFNGPNRQNARGKAMPVLVEVVIFSLELQESPQFNRRPEIPKLKVLLFKGQSESLV
ncbi:MAG: hypothetical protein LBS44_05355, partial [Deltaproteobacteria bacterium]|nr:hypothetical protein [Deltaproteobacteria bacterium]